MASFKFFSLLTTGFPWSGQNIGYTSTGLRQLDHRRFFLTNNDNFLTNIVKFTNTILSARIRIFIIYYKFSKLLIFSRNGKYFA